MARKKLGKYEIIDRIGRGGMAEVYRGYHAALDRYVAVKLLHPFLADDPEFKDRFENEARNVAKLKHPNIVQVYDFEYDAEGESYYMVMELINGPTLKDRLFEIVSSGERLSVGESIRIVKSAAEALAYAHQRSMIHRDVKPANLMLDEDQRVVLTDFGIAKIVTGTQFTASGGMVGTPAYMAPEQGLGEAGDERSDLYSLGVILYQLVTGKLPFDAETPLAIILKHLNEPLPAPHEIMSDIPQDLERVICRALAKDVEERYQSAADFAADLNRLDETGHLLPIYEAAARPAAITQELPVPELSAPEATIPSRPSSRPVLTGAPGRLRFSWVMGIVAGIVLMVSLALIGFGSDDSPFSGILGPRSSDTPQATLTALAQVPPVSTEDLTATVLAAITDTPSPTATVPTPTRTPRPSATPTLTETPTVTPSPLPTDTPTPTFTPSPNMTGTALANFYETQSAATPTPNMTQTLAACSLEFIVVDPQTYNQPPGVNAVNDPRLVEASEEFAFDLVLLNTGSCPWPKGARLTFNEDLTLDPGSSVDMEPLNDACEDTEIRPGTNFAVQQRSNFRLDDDVDIEEESAPILFQGTAPSVFGCYYGVWDLLYPNSNTPIGRPLLLTIRVWGGGR